MRISEDAVERLLNDEDRLIDVNEAALRLNVSCELVRRWIREGKLEGHRLSPRRTRIKLSVLNKFIADSALSQ